MGRWKEKSVWSLKWVQQDLDFLYTLGIYHSNDYKLTLKTNCDKSLNKIESHTRMLFGRKLTLL